MTEIVEQLLAYQISLKSAKNRLKSQKEQNSEHENKNSKLTSEIKTLQKQIEQLKKENSKLTELNNQQSKEKLKSQSQMENTLDKVNELKIFLEQKKKECSKADQLVSQHQKILKDISAVLDKKLNKKVPKPEDFAQEILNYNPPIGTKLVTSHILNGYDQQRSQIIKTIEKFTKKYIGRTDLLARYPEVKTILHPFSKDKKQFAFILLFETNSGTIYGSFSGGMRKPTFIFSFPSQEENGQNQPANVKFFIPQNPNQNNSIYLSDSTYLQYGSEELKLDCLEPSTISTNPNAMGENYYGLNWKQVMNGQNVEIIRLNGLELHKVDFE